jgi:pimeloyl-ACP methyl ester carboxylesterase
MATIVLVHGAWQGAWCWERLAPLLEHRGHQVLIPTLTGSGTRAEELTPSVTLETHIGDVLAVVWEAGRDDIVLVGHSYSGMVISGVTERAADRIASLVFVDAFYPNDGESALDQMPAQFQERFRAGAAQQGDGWRLPPHDGLLDIWGVRGEADRKWARDRITDWSLNCFTSPLRAPDMRRSRVPRVYVTAQAEGYPGHAVFGPLADRAVADGCDVFAVDAGHEIMIEAPRPLAEHILAAAKGAVR